MVQAVQSAKLPKSWVWTRLDSVADINPKILFELLDTLEVSLFRCVVLRR